ncbi:MAG: hypothetical protein EOM67_10355 [Spirochaetia bacterium]|nr:hypothetical protein [Spirochaetia bacterium]
MNAKFAYHMEDLKLYLINRVKAGAHRDQVVLEILRDFAPEVAFYKCPIDMIEEFVGQLYELAYILINNKPIERMLK